MKVYPKGLGRPTSIHNTGVSHFVSRTFSALEVIDESITTITGGTNDRHNEWKYHQLASSTIA
ncbi:hypothetical protein N7495_008167 [Penicillium taxi]|uniref:uncharacterized protein n=1 Tax=Penicillium taxi TaxID=168475 RepID=UPI0025453827|nr:uncharacterized protein N7495_008167 [Penicillium taxi]KAJ5888126.1 hypothetical protein N7495_008167 [Penicillium taxi]